MKEFSFETGIAHVDVLVLSLRNANASRPNRGQIVWN